MPISSRRQRSALVIMPWLSGEPVDRLAWDEINVQLQERGALIVLRPDCSRAALHELGSAMGRLQPHERSDADAIADVKESSDPAAARGVLDGVTTKALPFHTDGSGVHGAVLDLHGFLTRVTAPGVLLLACVAPAETGGITRLLDGREVFDRMTRFPEALCALHEPGFAFARGKLAAVGVPVFTKHASGRCLMRYHPSNLVALSPRHGQSVKVLQRVISETPSLDLRLPVGATLVLDNTRWLHARTEYSGGQRWLRRLWVAMPADDSDVAVSVDSSRHATAFRGAWLEHYRPHASTSPSLLTARLGISPKGRKGRT